MGYSEVEIYVVGLANSEDGGVGFFRAKKSTSVFTRVKWASHGMNFELVPIRFLILKLAMNICQRTQVGNDLILRRQRMSVSLQEYILGEFGLIPIEECYTTRMERQRINSEDLKPMTTLSF